MPKADITTRMTPLEQERERRLKLIEGYREMKVAELIELRKQHHTCNFEWQGWCACLLLDKIIKEKTLDKGIKV